MKIYKISYYLCEYIKLKRVNGINATCSFFYTQLFKFPYNEYLAFKLQIILW